MAEIGQDRAGTRQRPRERERERGRAAVEEVDEARAGADLVLT